MRACSEHIDKSFELKGKDLWLDGSCECGGPCLRQADESIQVREDGKEAEADRRQLHGRWGGAVVEVADE